MQRVCLALEPPDESVVIAALVILEKVQKVDFFQILEKVQKVYCHGSFPRDNL
jgi:hypothetical protein